MHDINAVKGAVITLCGSTKFKDEFQFWYKELSLHGNVVMTVTSFSHAENERLPRTQKLVADLLHLRKISMSDMIFVIDVGKYIGESTEREIMFAEMQKKQVYYLSDLRERAGLTSSN